MICKKCNHKLPNDSEFCQYCGSKIENLETMENNALDDNATELLNELNDPDITPDDALSAMLKFQAKATIDAMEANADSQPDNESDDDFGLVPEKPIFTLALKSVDGEKEYLDKLYTDSGEKIKYTRCGSTSAEGINGMIDIYDTFLPSGQPYKTIYINMYGAKSPVSAPRGFKLVSVKAATPVNKATTRFEKTSKPKKPINKKLWITASSISLVVIIILILLPTLIIPNTKYNHAKKLLENGNYELAYSEFEKLDGYADSENMLLECRYVQAIKYRDAGDYELANKIFESLGNYRDSKILIHKHNYKVSNTVAATCTVAGSETYKCTDCDHTYSETVAKLTHKYEVVASQDPTCQKEGYATHKCSLCSNEYTETKGKVSHDTILAATTDSTCTAVGAKNYKCKNCSHTYSEEIAKKSHNYSAATCTSPKTCSMCGKTEGSALGHSDTLICTKCDQSTFKTLTFTGTGEGFIRNLNLPKGKYLFIIETPTGDFIQLHINERYIGYNNMSQETYSVLSVTVSSAVTNGYLKVSADESWKITIEAVGN